MKNYGEYKSDNYGYHTIALDFGEITLYFSYQTIIAFAHRKIGFKVCENVWTSTTGKHLNWLESDKKRRIPRTEFKRLLSKALNYAKVEF